MEERPPRRARPSARATVVKLPEKIDLSAYLPAVRDQGNLGSCTGFGIGGNLTGCAKQQAVYSEWFSPTWIYNGGRLLEGCLGYDDGAFPRDCLEFLRSNGSLLEHFRPYRDTLDKTDPLTWGFLAEAAKWPVVHYARLVDGVDGILAALAAGHLVSLGSPWFGSWMETDAAGTLPADYSVNAGGHEYLCYGYDATLKLLYCQNSWGKAWGDHGRFAVPFSAIEAWKRDGGYDAHIVLVNWGTEDPGPGPDPDPITPDNKPNLTWLWFVLGALGLGGALVALKACG